MRQRPFATLLLLLALAWPLTVPAAGGYYRYPALHGDTLIFTAEGDLWKTTIAGGEARRLTTHAGAETHASISPDGQWVAFAASYEGPTEAYVMPINGGVPRRLTWFGGAAVVAGWTPQGEVMVLTRYFHPLARPQLVIVSRDTGAHRLVPLENAGSAAFLDAATLVFTRENHRGDNVRGYRGGAVNTLWRFHVAGGAEAEVLTPVSSNNANPLAWNGRIVFSSDRDGVTNLWSMQRDGRGARQHTQHKDFEVRGAAISGNRVVYQHGADLRVLDLATGQDRVVPIQLLSDFDQQRERWIGNPLSQFWHATLSTNGERVVIVARGRAVSAGIGTLRRIDIAVPAGARVRSAQFMPDGKSVLVVCDASGEYELWLFPADGSGPGRQLTRDADTTRWLAVPSPDGKWIVHHDRKQRLWLLDVVSGHNRLLDQGEAYGNFNFGEPRWAPDSSAFVAQVAGIDNQGRYGLTLYRAADGQKFELTSRRYSNFSPAFSPDGRWLWFLSNRHFEAALGTPWGERNLGPYFDRRTRAYAIALQPNSRFPFQPRDELAPPAPVKPEAAASGESDAQTVKPAPVAPGARPKIPPIAWEGLAERLHEVPLPASNYTALDSDGRRLWYLEAEGTERRTSLKTLAIDNAGAPPQVYLADVRQFALSEDRRKVFVRRWAAGVGAMHIVDVTPKPIPVAELPRQQVSLSDWRFSVAPRDEWRQIFTDAWRMQRDWFYDANMHGVDWPAIRRKYQALLPRVTDRAELSDLLAQMTSELSLLHSQVRMGDLRAGSDNILPATLGALFENAEGAEGGVRITRVFSGDPELLESLPPLAQPGVRVTAGDVITAIDGRAVKDVVELNTQLRDRAGKQVLLTLRSVTGEARKVVVTAAAASRDADFKRRDWVWQRRERVEAASKGRFGYLHLRAMGPADLADFVRDFYPVVDREGLIIDVRQNNGGNIDSIVIEKLLRRAWAYMQDRSGRRIWNMQSAFRGHIVVLIDAGTYSDGEAFAEGMRRLGLATLVGKRTAGAGVWLTDSNRLIDGGVMRAAEYGQMSLDGQWLIEGKGVAPDIEIDSPPHATFKGEDAQLAAAIRVLEEKLAGKPVAVPPALNYPRIPVKP